jgi:hypothetical protein
MWRSNAVIYVTVPYDKALFSIMHFFNRQSEVDLGIAYILQSGKYSNKTVKIIPSPLWPGNAVRKQRLTMQCQTSVK